MPGAQYLHLATHGLSGSEERPYDTGLLLAGSSDRPGADVLRLADIIQEWRGRLQECELVVLSACSTNMGAMRNGSMIALPWGFFYAGAPTVIASLWKVDDTATMLLMGRLYENLLGVYDGSRSIGGREYRPHEPMIKIDALREAKRWLRNLTVAEVKQLVDQHGDGETRGPGPRPAKVPEAMETHPYAAPHYWAAFILIGDPG